MKMWGFSLLTLIAGCGAVQTDQVNVAYRIGELIVADEFNFADTTMWVVESATNAGLADYINDNTLDIRVPEGITIWNATEFSGNVMIEYSVTAIEKGGVHDRVSDINCFWMATDPVNPDDFFRNTALRKGVFQNYYALKLYYAGYGGHDNTRTRFRKYNGIAEPRPEILREYTDAQHLIASNRENTVRIVCMNGIVKYYFNDELLLELNDEEPYQKGYFGFRTTNSHLKIDNFKVYSVKPI